MCRRRTPAAALVSLKDYQERFVGQESGERRRAGLARLKQLQVDPAPPQRTPLNLLRDLRS